MRNEDFTKREAGNARESGRHPGLGFSQVFIVLILCLAAAGCGHNHAASLAKQHSAGNSNTPPLAHAEESWLSTELMSQISGHPGQSGFYLLPSGMDAFLTRALMTDAAQHTLDLQYYIVENDTTTKLLFERLLRAADRGVRVRMLIDDNHAGGLGLSKLSGHPNIQVRIFNPYRNRYLGDYSRPFEMMLSPETADRRMHNKLFAVDGVAAIVGGRNLADPYFDARPAVNFTDLDLWAVGPIVRDLEASFKLYWESEWSYPISRFLIFHPTRAGVERIHEELARANKTAEDTDYVRNLRNSDLLKRLESGSMKLVWAAAEVSCDSPAKAAGETAQPHIGPRVRDLAERATSDTVFISPYFIPEGDGVKLISDLRRRGVRVRILTNAASATDIEPAYAAFARYRDRLLRLGCEIYELKPTAAFRRSMARRLFGSESKSSLHAKTYIFDGREVMIGSLNLDPRSRHRNTELSLIVHSAELSRQVEALFDEGALPKNSYHVVLQAPPGRPEAKPRVTWITEDPKTGKTATFYSEPDTGMKLSISKALLFLFPLEWAL